MRLIQLEVKNFCQHADCVVEFHPRLTAILGQNGSGKSNLLAAALGALTNDFSRTNGTKAENIRQGAGPDERSYVTLVFEHNGTRVEVRRGFQKSSSYWMEGDDTVRGDRAVTERVQQFLGASTTLINKFVFVEQGQIFAPLMARAADRGKAFQQLFGTAHAEVCWKAVGDHLSDMTVPEIGVALDALRGALSDVLESVNTCKRNISRISLPADYLPGDDPDFKLLEAYDKRVEDVDRLGILVTDIAAAEAELAPMTVKKSGLDVDVSSLTDALAGHEDKYEAAVRAAHNWDLLERQRKAAEVRENILAELEEELAQHPAPQKPADFVEEADLVEYQKETAFLESKRIGKEGMITALDPSKGVVECPTCSTPVADLEMDIEYAKADVVKLNTEIEVRYQVQAASMEYHTVLNRHEEWKMGWEARHEDLLEQTAGSVDVDAPLTEAEMVDAVETKERYEKWQTARAGAIDELRNVGQSIARREGVLAAKKREQAALEEQITTYESEGVTHEAANEARMVLPQRQAQYAERLQLEGQLSALTSNLEHRQADLAQAELRLNESRRLVSFSEHLREVRDTLHRDNLPRVVARNYLELLQESINTILESFATDYRVVATESLGFDACFLDGRVQQVPRLSGGQKVVLALAFRISINALFASDLGLLCLDEPTAYLDDENLACLDVALERLRALSESRGLQCILITHERGLEHLFDRVIQL